MDRYLAAGYLKGDLDTVSKNRNRHLGAGWTLHASDHAVLRELHTGDDLVIHAQETVSGQHSYLLGRPARNDLKDDGGIVGDVELYTYAIEIACKVGLGLLKFCRRHIY